MFRKITTTKLFKVMVAIAVFGLLVFFNPGKIFNPVRLVIFGAYYPFEKTFYFLSLKISDTKDFLSSIGSLKEDNKELIMENQKLLAENAMLRDMKSENALLREQLKLTPKQKFNLENALVIGQDSYGLSNWIIIDKGSSNGIKSGMPVIVSDGIMIGKIEEVYPKSSKASLLTNSQSIINAVVSGTETKGVVRGEYGLGIILDLVLQTEVLKIGDEVITSGIGGNAPRGLLIGKIQETRPSEDRLFQQAVIYPSAKFSELRLVSVIKNY
jgi:rod shape-determining protein MreC